MSDEELGFFSFEAVLYSVQVMMTTDTVLMQLHKCFSLLPSQIYVGSCRWLHPDWLLFAGPVSGLISPPEVVTSGPCTGAQVAADIV